MTQIRRVDDENSWEERLRRSPQYNLKMLCTRLGLNEEWAASNMNYPEFLHRYFITNYDAILMMLSKEQMDLLMSIWGQNGDIIDIDVSNRKHLFTLEDLGLIRVSFRDNQISVNREAKHDLYFYLNSKSAKKKIEEYQDLEDIIRGILYQCGMIELYEMHQTLKDGAWDITEDDLRHFAHRRFSLWNFVKVLQDGYGVLYLASVEVHDLEGVFALWKEKDMYYPHFSVGQAKHLGRINGIGTWKGTPEMLAFVLRNIDQNSRAAAVFMKQILIYIQNGAEIDYILSKMEAKLSDLSEEAREQFENYLNMMYQSVPIYGLRGRCRNELLLDRKESDKHSGFTVISGGRTEE